MRFNKYNIYGSTVYIDDDHKLSIHNFNDRWYIKNANEIIFNAGFVNITSAVNVITNLPHYIETLSQLGYEFEESTSTFYRCDTRFSSTVSIVEDTFIVNFEIVTYQDLNKTEYSKEKYETTDFEDLTDYIVKFFDNNDIEIFANVFIDSISNPIYASISSREITKNMVRVKSSNIWSYCIDIKNNGDKFGTVYVQFKGKEGGPNGGLYRYYSVPIKLWRKWIGTTSKGHFFWQFIRNNFKYSKLDGDKKGKLRNAIN